MTERNDAQRRAIGRPGSGAECKPRPDDPDAGGSDGIPIRVTVGATHLTARLHDTPTARDLAGRLPLTLTFRDLNGVEKTAPLHRKLSLGGAPEGDDPEVGNIGYWTPDGDLVFYYGDVGFWTGIVRIGRFDGELNAIERQRQDFEATVERDWAPAHRPELMRTDLTTTRRSL